jgi:hypothetical protein
MVREELPRLAGRVSESLDLANACAKSDGRPRAF